LSIKVVVLDSDCESSTGLCHYPSGVTDLLHHIYLEHSIMLAFTVVKTISTNDVGVRTNE
jgi:hypothetical protein